MTMIEEEVSFPRGGGGSRHQIETSTEDLKSKKQHSKHHKSSDKNEPLSIKTDVLFSVRKKKKSPNDDGNKSSSKRRKTTISSDVSGNIAALSANKHSLLPLGGGGVVLSTKRHKSKNKDGKPDAAAPTTVSPVIEALSFSKLAKGTKILACVREVHEEFAIVSLPNLLTGYILPQKQHGNSSDAISYPLTHTLSVGQILAVVIQSVVTESVGKGGQTQKRIQVTALPQAINPREILMGGETNNSHDSLIDTINQLSNAHVPVRGQILSIEDHGCVVDLGFGMRGFVSFEDVNNGKNYIVLEDDENDDDDDDDHHHRFLAQESEGFQNPTKLILQTGRLFDFLVLPPASNEKVSTVFPLSLPTSKTLAKKTVISTPVTRKNRQGDRQMNKVVTTPFTLSSLTPGWLVQVKVEAIANNGICVSFFGNVFRGAMEMNHLGATFLPSAKENTGMSGMDGAWKFHANRLFHTHQHFVARILAVDVPTKLIRLSIASHVLKLDNLAGINSSSLGFPKVGTIIPDCTVVKLDPGIGALLALPSQYDIPDANDRFLPKTLMKSSELFGISEFQQACHIRRVYVHISKALDETNNPGSKESARGTFHKEFAPSTKHAVRILNTSHWMEGMAAGGCAPSILNAHVLTHEDLEPGKVYKQVPISAHLSGGSVLVELGGTSGRNSKSSKAGVEQRSKICGLIPATQLFDTTTSGGSEYRQRVFQAKYALGAKVDVRVLSVDPVRKRCLVTAKKSLVQASPEEIITQYNKAEVGQVAKGFISKLDDQGLYVTFCNKVYGRVTARSMTAELGVENHKEAYSVGDVVTCRVVKLRQIRQKRVTSSSLDEDNLDIELRTEEDNGASKDSFQGHWELTLSFKLQQGDDEDDFDDDHIRHPRQVRLRAGAVLPSKSMKIVGMVDGREKKSGGYIPGHAVVLVKSKYVVSDECLGPGTMSTNIECKLPFDQLLDTFDPMDVQSVEALDKLANRLLTIGKKINQKGLVLNDPRKSNIDYSSGIGKMAIVSLKRSLIQTREKQIIEPDLDIEKNPMIPLPNDDLFVGALLHGYVVQLDDRYGAFVRFLDGMTGLVPKRSGGLRLHLYDTVVTRIEVIDDTVRPHRILLKGHLAQSMENESDPFRYSVNIGDKIPYAKVVKVEFHQLSLSVPTQASESRRERYFIHCTNKESSITTIMHDRRSLSNKGKQHFIGKSHPFYGIKCGHKLDNLTVVSIKRRKGHDDIYVTDRKMENKCETSEQIKAPFHVENSSQAQPGMKLRAVAMGFGKENKGLHVQIGPFVRGFVPGLELSRDVAVLNALESHIERGTVLECVALDSAKWLENRSKAVLRFSHRKSSKYGHEQSRESPVFLSVLACEKGSTQSYLASRGQLVIGRVNKSLSALRPPSLMLELRGGYVARCCVTELCEPDDWENMPLRQGQSLTGSINADNASSVFDPVGPEENSSEHEEDNQARKGNEGDAEETGIYRDGEYVECRVLDLYEKGSIADVSFRPSRVQGDLDEDPVPEEGEIIQGYVVQTNKNGCFVRISRTVEGRSTLRELCDGFLPSPEAAFPIGRLVVGKVKGSRSLEKKGKHNADIVKTLLDLDMRESILLQEQENHLKFEDVIVGEKYKGTVQRIEDYGVFVRIQNSNVSGLVHMSECSDHFIKNLPALYNPGDLVKVLVLKKDDESGKAGFSMKASHFENDTESEESSLDSDMEDAGNDDEEDVEMKDARELREDSDTDSRSDENYMTKIAAEVGNGNGEESGVQKLLENKGEGSDEDSESSDDDDDEDSGPDIDSSEEQEEKEQMFDTAVGFFWGAGALGKQSGFAAAEKLDDSSATSDSDEDEDDDEDETNEKSKSHKSRKRQAEKRRQEQEVSRREMALADGTADENPQTAGDFERLLAGEPNNSELWIRYMAFYLSLADIPSARKVAEKALERIEFRQEKEKLNVWTALLTLEHKYGSEETFQTAIQRACTQNSSKQVYLRACEILEKELEKTPNDSSLVVRADNMFATMCRKHKSKKKAWLAHMQYLLRHSRHQDAHVLMKRALLSLASYKHAETMSRFAQMEFELGSAERGRTLFDGLLLKYPKRLDLFFVYLDKECKHGNIDHARSMLEKKVEERKLSDKKMKSLFKKWYRMEEEHGTEETQEHVKESARKYVSGTRT